MFNYVLFLVKASILSNKYLFVKEALKSYKTSGTIVPSSRFLAKKMLKRINFSSANVIVELGPGNGAFTKDILKKMDSKTTLVCFEINDTFYEELKLIKHPNLKVIKASAEFLDVELAKIGYTKVDHIISSVPLSILPKPLSTAILKQSYAVLKSKGLFVQYQYSLGYYEELRELFLKQNISLSFEPINVPPAFIYYCMKK